MTNEEIGNELDITRQKAGRWRKRYAESGIDGISQKESGFVPVTVNSQPVTTALSIQLPNGLVLRGIDRDNLELVYQMLSRLS